MSTLLKDKYNQEFYDYFCDALQKVHQSLNREKFMNDIFQSSFEQMELKERMKHTRLVLNNHLAKDYLSNLKTICKLSEILFQQEPSKYSLELMFLPDFVETYGIDYFEESTDAFEIISPLSSCEFAVRPFIIKYEKQMMAKMLNWSSHPNHHIRRLASEGSRPRLPWAIALPQFKKDPTPCIPILEALKDDESEYVRRSVANHLNDISKDHPELLVSIAQNWFGKNKETDALIKHGCRTLLKQAYPPVLKLFGLKDSNHVLLKEFKIHQRKIKSGESLGFSFKIQNCGNKTSKLRIEYAMYFLRSNGNYAKKVFKISERVIEVKEQIHLEKNHSFKPISTRKYYTGLQKISLILNGIEKANSEFQYENI